MDSHNTQALKIISEIYNYNIFDIGITSNKLKFNYLSMIKDTICSCKIDLETKEIVVQASYIDNEYLIRDNEIDTIQILCNIIKIKDYMTSLNVGINMDDGLKFTTELSRITGLKIDDTLEFFDKLLLILNRAISENIFEDITGIDIGIYPSVIRYKHVDIVKHWMTKEFTQYFSNYYHTELRVRLNVYRDYSTFRSDGYTQVYLSSNFIYALKYLKEIELDNVKAKIIYTNNGTLEIQHLDNTSYEQNNLIVNNTYIEYNTLKILGNYVIIKDMPPSGVRKEYILNIKKD